MGTIEFPSKDGLLITADMYPAEHSSGMILLCHRSHFNRGEYREIAPKLNKLDWSCLAIDQRSGMTVLGTINETYLRAKASGKKTGYLDAKPDIRSAINYAFKMNQNKPVIVVGSSYSASLALLIASEDSSKLAGVVAFSPGEYLKGVKLADALDRLHVPTLVFSSLQEVNDTKALLQTADQRYIRQYVPESMGAHGARVLWKKTNGHKEYWSELETFLHSVALGN